MKKELTNTVSDDSSPIRRSVAPTVEANGAAWETLASKVTITPKKVATALREAGFWTAADVEARPRKAQRILCGLLGYSAISLARATRQVKEANNVE